MNATRFPATGPAANRLAAAVLLSMGLHGGAALWLSSFPQGSGLARDGSAPALTVLALPQNEDSKRSPADRRTRPMAAGFEDEESGIAGNPQRYFALSELDRRPVALVSVNPAYPELALQRTRFVVLAILVNEHGSVDRVIPMTDSPGDPFRESAAAAFSKARFAPGMKDGVAVKSRVLVEVSFENDPGDATAAPSLLSTAPNLQRHSIP